MGLPRRSGLLDVSLSDLIQAALMLRYKSLEDLM